MIWIQKPVVLEARPRGFHLVTAEVEQAVPELRRLGIGVAHVFIQHTSAALTLNENASPEVRRDFERHFNRMVPEDQPDFEHTLEGPDDMPAHLKASILGSGVTVPVRGGRLALGTWQGLYLCEHRDRAGRRRLLVTAWGEGGVRD